MRALDKVERLALSFLRKIKSISELTTDHRAGFRVVGPTGAQYGGYLLCSGFLLSLCAVSDRDNLHTYSYNITEQFSLLSQVGP